jgi:lysozyme family protein
MVDIEALKLANARRWAVAKLDPGLVLALDTVARRLIAADAKSRYLAVAQETSVPWFIVAVIHERESAQSWAASLAQGDPWNAVSIHVPAGRGPFTSWAYAAIDALENCPPRAAGWNDWSAGGGLTLLEQYNGLGYAAKGRPSPYVWASTDQYSSGKYIADGRYDPDAVDRQLGCAALLMRMALLDGTVKF